MDARTAMRKAKQGEILPFYLCYGTETFLIQEFIRFMTDRILNGEERQFAVSKFQLSETPLQEVIEDAETLPFMARHKLVIAQGADFLTGSRGKPQAEHDTDRLLDYLRSPAPYSTVIMTVDSDKLDERKKVVKELRKSGCLLPFPAMGTEQLKLWMKQRAQKYGCRLEEDAAERLLFNTGADLYRIDSELEKLSSYSGETGVIGVGAVDELVPRTAEQNVFLLVDEIIQRRFDRAVWLLHKLLEQREEPTHILALVTRQFRLMIQAKELERKGYTHQQMASLTGQNPYSFKLAARQARHYGEHQLIDLMERLAELNFRMKRGLEDKARGLERFILQFARAVEDEEDK